MPAASVQAAPIRSISRGATRAATSSEMIAIGSVLAPVASGE